MDLEKVWDAKAQTFPRFKEGASDTLEILEFFRENGADFKGASIIDIGCGNGRFALELAKEAGQIYATDISGTMLHNLATDAESLGFDNVRTLQSAWDSFSEKISVDYALASMTPALNNKQGFLKALHFPQKALCYIGWGRVRKSGFLDEILKAHNLKLELPVGLPNVLKWLDEEGFRTPPFRYIQSGFEYKSDTQKAIKDIKWHISVHNGTPNDELIESFVRENATNGEICYYQEREVGIAYIERIPQTRGIPRESLESHNPKNPRDSQESKQDSRES